MFPYTLQGFLFFQVHPDINFSILVIPQQNNIIYSPAWYIAYYLIYCYFAHFLLENKDFPAVLSSALLFVGQCEPSNETLWARKTLNISSRSYKSQRKSLIKWDSKRVKAELVQSSPCLKNSPGIYKIIILYSVNR